MITKPRRSHVRVVGGARTLSTRGAPEPERHESTEKEKDANGAHSLKYAKESYLTRDPDPEAWEDHANVGIIREWSEYIVGTVGDFGCNHGACTTFLEECDTTAVFGIDINRHALSVARERNYGHGIRYVQADLRDLPFRDEFFDTAVSFHTLEHIYPDDAKRVMSEFRRVVRDGGHLILSIPYGLAHNDPCHVSFYDSRSLTRLLERCGFAVLRIFKDDRFSEEGLLTALSKVPGRK